MFLTENFDAHEDAEADDDEGQLSHAGDLNLGLFSLENFEDHDVDQSSASQSLKSKSSDNEPGGPVEKHYYSVLQMILVDTFGKC